MWRRLLGTDSVDGMLLRWFGWSLRDSSRIGWWVESEEEILNIDFWIFLEDLHESKKGRDGV